MFHSDTPSLIITFKSFREIAFAKREGQLLNLQLPAEPAPFVFVIHLSSIRLAYTVESLNTQQPGFVPNVHT